MNETDWLLDVLRGNTDAVEFVSLLGEVSQTWDDLIDQDREVTPERINHAFLIPFYYLPRNAFYQQHLTELQPVIETAIIDWFSANTFEQTSERLELAYVLRDNLAQVVLTTAKLIGGMDWAIQQGPRVRQLVHDETLPAYKVKLNEHGLDTKS